MPRESGLPRDRIMVGSYLGTRLAPLGVAVDAFVGKVRIGSLSEIHPSAAEVQSVFSIPVEWFRARHPDARGKVEYLLPVQ